MKGMQLLPLVSVLLSLAASLIYCAPAGLFEVYTNLKLLVREVKDSLRTTKSVDATCKAIVAGVVRSPRSSDNVSMVLVLFNRDGVVTARAEACGGKLGYASTARPWLRAPAPKAASPAVKPSSPSLRPASRPPSRGLSPIPAAAAASGAPVSHVMSKDDNSKAPTAAPLLSMFNPPPAATAAPPPGATPSHHQPSNPAKKASALSSLFDNAAADAPPAAARPAVASFVLPTASSHAAEHRPSVDVASVVCTTGDVDISVDGFADAADGATVALSTEVA